MFVFLIKKPGIGTGFPQSVSEKMVGCKRIRIVAAIFLCKTTSRLRCAQSKLYPPLSQTMHRYTVAQTSYGTLPVSIT
jgi:hypothetical protein